MEEKRKYPRFDIKANIKFQKVQGVESLQEGHLKDISAEGFCFGCDEEFSLGDILEIEVFEQHDPNNPLFVKGEVVWTQENPKSQEDHAAAKFLTGIKILGVRETDEARFTMYYCERVIDELRRYYHLQ